MTTATQRQLRRGTTAEVNAMTPAVGEIVADTTLNQLVLGNGSTPGGVKVPTTLTVSTAISTALSSLITPGGRLTLTSNTPVLSANSTAQSTIYYTPHVSDIVPVYDGTNTVPTIFSQLSLALDSTDNTSGNLYDVFVYSNAGVLTLGTGPAWTSSTARGTGAGTTELQMKNGIWTNKNAITLRAGGVSLGSIATNQATYLGTFYATANGQTGMNFKPSAASGGNNNILGLYNAYNRVPVMARSSDSGNWTYATATVRAANASNSNRVSFIDGLQQSAIDAAYQVQHSGSAGNTYAIVGTGLDSITAFSGATGVATGAAGQMALCRDVYLPQLGFHYVSANEQCITVTSSFNNLSAASMCLMVSLMM